MKRILVSGGFDDFRSPQVRFLQEANRLGRVHVLLWSDAVLSTRTGGAARFPEAERAYLVRSNRYVAQVIPVEEDPARDDSVIESLDPDLWLDREQDPDTAAFCSRAGIEYRVLPAEELAGFPEHGAAARRAGEGSGKKVVVSGCFDWFHSGHVRFFEEASGYGDLYVVVGSDRNLELLKGRGHPLFPETERRYLVGSVRYVTGAMVSSGRGWLDAKPEILALRPDLYVVNEDGDRPEKREFCRKIDLEYLVLKRAPKRGLVRRSSTELRGF